MRSTSAPDQRRGRAFARRRCGLHLLSDNAHYVSSDGAGGWIGDDWTVPGYDSDVPVEVAIGRILRRWAKANGKHRKVRVTVPDVRRRNDPGVINVGGRLIDALTGQILERRLTVVRGPFVRRGAGFVSVNDGVAFASQLRRAVTGEPGTSSVAESDAAAVADIAKRRRAREEYAAALRLPSAA